MAFNVLSRHNGALNANPPGGDAHITTHASDFLWFVFAVMLLSLFVALGWTCSDRTKNRIQHAIPLLVLFVASVAYFLMASDIGWTLIRSEFGSHEIRQIFYVRYVQWFINAPLILLSLLSFTSLATVQILVVLFFSWAFVICGLIGALIPSSYKWALYAFGLFSLFFIWAALLGYVLLFTFRNADYRAGYWVGAVYISFIWLLYPISWGLSEGSNTISPTSEMVFYGILDLLSGPVFLLTYLYYLGRFDTQALVPTAFGNAERGFYGQLPQQPQQQQPPALQKGPQPAVDSAHPALEA